MSGSSISPVSVRVRLLGHPCFDDGAGQPRLPPRGQKSWALLGRVALADRPMTRGELAAELFGEADDPEGITASPALRARAEALGG